jgi:NitT/TauT family transport system ATP-binding protein
MMDEPFGALDEITRDRLNEQLQQLWQRERRTVVFVTHSIAEAVYLSQRVVVMAARPVRIIADLDTTAPYPRTPDYRTSPLYNDHCRNASHALEVAMGHALGAH